MSTTSGIIIVFTPRELLYVGGSDGSRGSGIGGKKNIINEIYSKIKGFE